MENTTYEANDGTVVFNLSTILVAQEEMHTTAAQQSLYTQSSFTSVVTEEWITFENEFDNNGTLNSTEAVSVSVQQLSDWQIFIASASAVFSSITVLGNLLVLYAFCAERRLRTYTNYYIVGLSIADLVAGAFTMPMYTVYWVLGYWPLGDALCDTYLYVNHVFLHVSVLAILVLAFDRYQAVSQPLKHLQRRTLSHACYMIGIAYVVPILIWLPYIIIWPYITGSTKTAYTCIPYYVIESLTFSILAPIIFFWIPFPIISFMYWRIYLVMKSKKTQRRGRVMMQELSTSTSRVTVAGDTTPSNISVKVQPPQRQHTDDIADVNIILDNGNNQQELGQENPAFDLNEEEQYVRSPSAPTARRNNRRRQWQVRRKTERVARKATGQPVP
ncbi:muscarinic acetylcholine receptor M3-like [Asterias rubens]|uniref:muscarinic acetylcholine receptor M3-like n=1 Tax=Asterias rubens TaxID=7604 RepID=UPI001454FB9A|nr:muscarinic acetylcholine receptor M3-like [Asterias rubens]